MPREITSHKVTGVNDGLDIQVVDEPGCGGANHRYQIDGPIRTIGGESAPSFRVDVRFQDGPIKENGINGITHESLLAILIDRLEGFQRGPFACRENEVSLSLLRSAMGNLHHRTKVRAERGVEGTLQK